MAPCASRLVLGVWRGGWEALLGGSLCRLSVPVAGSLTSGSTWWCRPRSEQTGHDAGLQPALLGLSILPLSARHHPVACQATTRLAACLYRCDSLHFVAVYAVLLHVASRAFRVFPSGREALLSLRASCVKCGSRRLQQMIGHVYVSLLYIIMCVTVSMSTIISEDPCCSLRQPRHVRSGAFHQHRVTDYVSKAKLHS